MRCAITLHVLLGLSSLACLAQKAAAQFASGNLIVVRIGDGSSALSAAAAPVFLDEYTPAGVLVRSVPLPTTASGAHQALTNSGSATSEGFLNVSVDGHYLVSGGYAAAPGTPSVATTSSVAVGRVIARTSLDGAMDTTTSLNAFSGGNIRSVVSSDGVQFWAAGSNSGIQYATLGSTTAVVLNSTAPTNNRVVGIFAGQLYVSSASGAFQGVCTVGTGLPVVGGQTITILPGLPTAAGPSTYDYFFADPNTLYLSDDRTNGSGGIQKWTRSGGTWTLQQTFSPSPTTGCRALTGAVSGGTVTLYATTTANQIVKLVDIGPGSVFTVVAPAATNTAFRGLRVVPGLGSIVRIPHGCGQTTITTTGEPRIGGSLTMSLGNVTGAPLIAVGFGFGGIPFCTCTLGLNFFFHLVAGSSVPISIPNDPSLIGGQVGFQGFDVFSSGGCPSPPITLTDTLIVTVG